MSNKLLDALRARRAELDIAIRVLERELGDAPEQGRDRQARAALTLHNHNGHAPRPTKTRAIVVNRARPEVAEHELPAGLTLKGQSVQDAIRLVFEAMPDTALPTPELASLLKRAGIKVRGKYPLRVIGQNAGSLAVAGELKKTAEGWRKGKHLETVTIEGA